MYACGPWIISTPNEYYNPTFLLSSQKSIRYNPGFDVLLLREVLAQNPYENAENWSEVTKSFNTSMKQNRPDAVPVNDRSIKERVDKLIKAFKSEQMAALRR
jgi:hypothetical protein